MSCSSKKELNVDGEDAAVSNEQIELTILFIDGVAEEAKGNYDKALVYYQKCLKRNEQEPAIHFALSQTYIKTTDFTSALKHAEKAVDLDSKNIWYHYNLAEIYQQTNQFSKAAKSYYTVYLEKKEIFYLSQYIDNLIFAKEYESAIKAFDILEKETGFNIELLYQKYLCLP